MANQLSKFSAGVTDKGIDSHNSDIDSELRLTKESKNIMSGINQGIGPRYGMSPIPGHSNLDIENSNFNGGLRSSEQSSGPAFLNREKFLDITPVSVINPSDVKKNGKQFVFMVADLDTNYFLSPVSPVLNDGSGNYLYKFDVGYGFGPRFYKQADLNSGSNDMTGFRSPTAIKLAVPYTSGITAESFLKNFHNIEDDIYFGSFDSIAVNGPNLPMRWIMGTKVADGDSSNTATANFNLIEFEAGISSTATKLGGGICPSWNLKNFKKSTRTLNFYNFEDLVFIRRYIYSNFPVTEDTYVQTFDQDQSTSNYDVSSGTAEEIENSASTSFTASAITGVLLNDNELSIDSSYKIIVAAIKKPLGFIIQDWSRNAAQLNIQPAPLTDRRFKPRDVKTAGGYASLETTVRYTENGEEVDTCFSIWPTWVRDTAMGAGFSSVGLGSANTGVLRANTNYEFTFSILDKSLNSETNVGTPVKFCTGNDDFVSLIIQKRTSQVAPIDSLYSIISGLPYEGGDSGSNANDYDVRSYFGDGTSLSFDQPDNINHLEVRFYYRALGSYEWLPALFIDLAKFWFYPDFNGELLACEGTQAGLPGGQPGGFVDYSFLEEDAYDCVVTYKNRAFWFSKDKMSFSLRNNLLAYPIRNTAVSPKAGWRGAIVHTFRSDSDQEARLVIFGGEETFIGRFTGFRKEQPIVVSPGVTANYEIDGSDFNIETWTSVTAFSYRAAVVADGLLYWWGEQGIYLDNGVGNPEKISKRLEPEIFDYYDPSLIDEIHAVYDDHTKEIIWFYPPKSDNTITHGLVLNVETGEFFPQEWDCKIDWAKRINTANTDVTQDTNNLRTVVSVRKDSSETVQRGFFLDRLNRSGDMRPETELLVKEVADGSSSDQKVLTLDSGYNATNFATISTNDLIALQQFKKYTGQSTGDDIVAKVVSTNAGADQLTITLPSGATLPNVDISDHRNYTPIWHAAANGQGLNGIPWVIQSKYWLPASAYQSWIFQWVHMFFKYVRWKRTADNSFDFTYRTLVSESTITDAINMKNNSDANFQLFHAFREGCLNNQGQAIKMKLSGVHIGDEWVLQYLEAHAQEEDGDMLRQFQG